MYLWITFVGLPTQYQLIQKRCASRHSQHERKPRANAPKAPWFCFRVRHSVPLEVTITEPAFQISRLQPQFPRYLKSWYFFIIISELDMNLVVFIMCCGLYNMLNNAFKLWLCNILDVAGLPDYLDIPNFYIISKHTKINHNSCFGRFWEDLHENKKMFVLACQSVTSRDALLKSAATRRLLIASMRLLSRWVSIRHPCRGVTLCDIIWKARAKIIDGLLQFAVDRFIRPKKWEVYLIHI